MSGVSAGAPPRGGGNKGKKSAAAQPTATTPAAPTHHARKTEQKITSVVSTTTTSASTAPAPASSSTPVVPPPHSGRPPRPPPPPIDPKLNGPDDYWALLPIIIITIITAIVMYQCAPGRHQWSPPVDHNSHFLSYEFPGRGMIGGSGFLASSFTKVVDASGARIDGSLIPTPTLSRNLGHGGITLGTRTWWKQIGRRKIVDQLRNVFLTHTMAIVIGPMGSGRSSIISNYIDTTGIATTPTTTPTKSLPASQPYNVILWFDGTSLSSLKRDLLLLHSHLRLQTMNFDTSEILQDLHAWLYKQERWLIIIDHCQIMKNELETFIPKRGGQVIVVLDTPTTTPTTTQVDNKHQTGILHGYDLNERNVIRVKPLTNKLSVTLFKRIAGLDSDATQTVASISNLLLGGVGDGKSIDAIGSTGTIVVASLIYKRYQNDVSLTTFLNVLQTYKTFACATPFEALMKEILLPKLEQELKLKDIPTNFVIRFFVGILEAMTKMTTLPRENDNNGSTIQSLSVPRELIVAMLTSSSSASPSSFDVTSNHLDILLRILSQVGLASESSLDISGEIVTSIYIPTWFLMHLSDIQQRVLQPKLNGSNLSSYGISTLDWPSLASLVSSDGGLLLPLIAAIGQSSRAAYGIPTPSIVAANPQFIPPIRKPFQLYLSGFGIIAESEDSPLHRIPIERILRFLSSHYGAVGDASLADGDTRSSVDRRNSQAARAGRLIATLENLLDRITSSSAASSSLSSATLASMNEIRLMVGCYLLDIAHEPTNALRHFREMLNTILASTSSSSSSTSIPTRMVSNPLVKRGLVSKNGLGQHALLVNHTILTRPEVPVSSSFATTLSLIGLTHVFLKDGSEGSATLIDGEVRINLELGLNYIMLAREIRKILVVGVDDAGDISHDENDSILHPTIASLNSHIGHIHALQRDLEGAKSSYALSLHQYQSMSIHTIDESFAQQLRTQHLADSSSSLPDYSSTQRFDPTLNVSNSSSRHWSRVIHQLALIRDLSLLAHAESVLFYYENASKLHERAYGLETALFTTGSLASANRWLHLGHVYSWHQNPSEAHHYYEAALESHKLILKEHVDLRLIQCHFFLGRSHNANGRGRSGRRSIEHAAQLKPLAIGGEIHLALQPQLETLGDTNYALGQYQDALTWYRQLLTLHQTIYGDSHSLTLQWKNKVLSIYGVIQQVNEESKRKQQQAQQEQLKKLQAQRAKEEEERRVKAAARGGHTQKEL